MAPAATRRPPDPIPRPRRPAVILAGCEPPLHPAAAPANPAHATAREEETAPPHRIAAHLISSTALCKSGTPSCQSGSSTPASNPQPRYRRNGQYSIIALTDGVGAISERYAYSAYGELTVLDGSGTVQSTSDNRYTYTGREWDGSLELYHYRARMYDPVAGRFLGRDPIGYLGRMHLQSYVANRPLKYLDPYGEYEFVFDPDFESTQRLRVLFAVARITFRLLQFQRDLDALESGLSECMKAKTAADRRILRDMLDCLMDNLVSDEQLLLVHREYHWWETLSWRRRRVDLYWKGSG